MRKTCVLLLIVILGLISVPSHANDMNTLLESVHGPKKTVAVFVEVMQTMYGSNDGVKLVGERIGDILPTNKLTILPIEKSMRELTFWKEDNMLVPVTTGYATVKAPREGLIEVAEKLGGVDYIAAIIITSGTPTYAAGMGTVAQRQNVTLDVRIIDPKSGEYLTDAKVDASEKGKTGALSTAGNSAIFLKTLNSAIDQIKLDVSGL